MAYWCDGVIELSREEFEEWLNKHYAPTGRGPIVYGVPRVNKSNQTIEIAFAAGSDDAPPQQWADKPRAIVEWEGEE